MATNINYGKKQHLGVAFLLPRVRSMSCGVIESTSDVQEWLIGSVTLIYCNEPFTWVLLLLKGLTKSKAVGDANTSYLFYSLVWNMKWSFNDSCAQLNRNLTTLKIQGNDWHTDKWREGGIRWSWIKAEGVHFCLKKLNSAPCWRFWIQIV